MPSPWNQDYAILAIWGRDRTALQFATNALITKDVRRNIHGNFALVRQDQVIGDSIYFRSTDLTDLGTEKPATETETNTWSMETRVLVFAGVASLLIIVVIIIWGTIHFFRRRPSRS